MQKLAKREEQIMQVLWRLERAFIKEIAEQLPEPKPHYNTVATIIKILEDKGFVKHETLGNSHRYFPIVSQENYKKQAIGDILAQYFNNSHKSLVAFFAEEKDINESELEEIIELIKKNRS